MSRSTRQAAGIDVKPLSNPEQINPQQLATTPRSGQKTDVQLNGVMRFPTITSRPNPSATSTALLPTQPTPSEQTSELKTKKSDRSTTTGDVAFIAPREIDPTEEPYKSDPEASAAAMGRPPPPVVRLTIDDPYLKKESPRSPIKTDAKKDKQANRKKRKQ